jgi:hypothetical protein
MSVESWIGILVGISTIISASAMGVKWLVKHYFDDIKHELKPNGGSSLKDQVNRLEKEIKEAEIKRQDMSEKIDHMYDLLLDFFANQSKTPRSRK